MKERVKWLDGLRGLSCLMIFTAHFMLGFFPATQYGAPSHGLFQWDEAFSVSFFRCILEGRFWVGLFCLISGYVLCLQILRAQKKPNPLSLVAKRYFRLMPPVFFLSLVVWIMLYFGLFSHMQTVSITGSPWLSSSYVGPVPFTDVLKEALLLVWIEPHVSFSNAFWVLPVFFLGSFLAYGAAALIRYGKKRPLTAWLLVGAVFCLLLFFQQYFYLMILLGAVLAIGTERSEKEEKPFPLPVILILIAAGIVTASIPTDFCLDRSPAYQAAASFFGRFTGNVHDAGYMVGGFLVFYGVMRCPTIRAGLSKNAFQKLNEISYAVYLIHIPLIYSFSCFLFNGIYHGIGNYQIAALLVYLISLAVLLVLSFFCTKLIEKPLYQLLKKLVDR